ncbi:hypothetical protein ACQKE4_16245 [Halomonas sp. NPDC076908]|uniref:hypothetical protein n=1 Tax=Halomonas sp. NPDC076908 TaxID=3390567 RepID=UPI003D079A80
MPGWLPEEVSQKLKSVLARKVRIWTLDIGVKASWVRESAVYSESFQLGWTLEERIQGNVMVVSRKVHVWQGLNNIKWATCWKPSPGAPAGSSSALGRVVGAQQYD